MNCYQTDSRTRGFAPRPLERFAFVRELRLTGTHPRKSATHRTKARSGSETHPRDSLSHYRKVRQESGESKKNDQTDREGQRKAPTVRVVAFTGSWSLKKNAIQLIDLIGIIMAKCDQGYLCEVCGEEVTSIVESDLYLRYVLGQLDAEKLHLSPERHLRCNPTLSQYIDDERFPTVVIEGEFDKRTMQPEFVVQHTNRVTRAYLRLWEIAASEQPISLLDYPLTEM
jgi:hypothetical protein